MRGLVSRTDVIVTMAGEGSRFRNAGYTTPKYEIEAHGRSLFSWSMESLRGFAEAGCEFLFIARSHANARKFIQDECAAAGIGRFQVLTIDEPTDGQATTAMLAEGLSRDHGAPIAIYNIDTYVDPAGLRLNEIRGQGWIPCFAGEGDKWSFAASDSLGRVTEVREKKRISPHATIGLYWFDSLNRYSEAYRAYYSHAGRIEARERYIAPLYNHLIADGAEVYMQQVPARFVHPLGTPEDVETFSGKPALVSSANY